MTALNQREQLERTALLAFERLADPDLDPQARAQLLDATAPDIRAIVGELEAADGRATGLFATRFLSQAGKPRTHPDRIGSYHLTGLIGAGGMGEVWRAERVDGLFDQVVAVKLLRRTLYSTSALDQFAEERRILARMRHPHITQLFDGGLNDDGVPYIIMELIQGEPITDWAARKALGLAERLALFQQAAEAVEYAHRNLIVHADIKPSNVVVEDDFGVKLLDFGIARLLQGEDRARNAYTAAYASPAQMAGHAPTPADDIFAAGKLLAELVSSQPGCDEDLVAVRDKAAASDPTWRYGTIRELLDDLERWRGRRPVAARPARRSRALTLFCRRNRLKLGVGGGALLSLLATLTAVTLLWLHAERARASAEQRFGETRAMANYMLSELDPTLARLPGTLPARQELVARGRAYLEGLGRDPNAGPDLQLDIAAGYLRLARIYGLDVSGGLGEMALARQSLQKAAALIARAARADPGDPRLLLLQAQYDVIGASDVVSAPENSRLEHARTSLGAAQQLFARYLHREPGSVEAKLGLWKAEVMTGRVYTYLGRPELGIRFIEPTLSQAAMAVATPTQRAERDFIFNGAELLLAEAYDPSDRARSFAYYEMVVDDVLHLRAQGLSGLEDDYLLATALAGRAAQEGAGRPGVEAAVRDYAQSEREMNRLLEVGPNFALAESRAYVNIHLAAADAKLSHYGSARQASDQAIGWLRRASSGHQDVGRLLAIALQSRGSIEQQAGDTTAACSVDHEAAKRWGELAASKAVMRIDVAPGGPIPKLRKAMTNCPSSLLSATRPIASGLRRSARSNAATRPAPPASAV